MKKVVALSLAMALCLSCACAFAAGSKTTSNVVYTVPTVTETAPEVVVVAPTAESQAVLDEIASFVEAGKPAVEYFEEDVKTAIAAAIPATVKAEDLKVDEFFPVVVLNKTVSGSAQVKLSTAASYKATDAVVTLLGIIRNGKTVWTVVPCAIVDGKIVVDLTADMLAQINSGSAVISILSNKN